MAFTKHFEGLADRVTKRWQRAYPEPSGTDTEIVPDSGEDDDESLFPLFGDSSTVRAYEQRVRLIESRKGKYGLYNEMDSESPEFSSSLDIYADNATRGEQGKEALTIKAEKQEVARILNEVRKDLGLDVILWTMARDIAKFGERAEEIIVNNNYRIVRLKPLPTLTIIPQVDEYGRKGDPAYIQVDPEEPEKVRAEFKDWQILYFANKKSRADLHGEGLGFSARRSFLQLRMMEDAVVIARLTRAHNRLAYLVDTGNMTPKDAQKHLKKVKEHLRKRRSVNLHTGKMELNWSPLSVEEDIFVATNKDSKADVKVLQGDLTVGNLADLEYFQQKQFTSYKVPKVYLAHEKDSRARAVVSEADIQFARSVRRFQHVIEGEIRKLFDLALLLRGINPKQVHYEVSLPAISIIDELRLWQTQQLKGLVAQMWKQTFWASDEWILTELLNYPKDAVDKLLKDQDKPDRFNGLYQKPKIGNAPNNTKVSKEEIAEKLAMLSEEDFLQFERAVEDLHMLVQWQM